MANSSAVIQSEFSSPIAWRRDTLAADAGLLSINQDCLDELDGVISHLRANPLSVHLITPDLFEMPACRTLMAAVSDVLRDGVGFAIIDRLVLDEYTKQEAVTLYWLLASMVARPVAQKWNGRMIYDVYDSGQNPGHGVRPDITNVEQNFHTDNSYNHCPPHYLGLLCLHTAKQGGVSRIVSFPSVHNEMLRRHRELLPRLYQSYYFDRQREHAPGDAKTIFHPLFANDDGALVARLSHFQVFNGYALAGAEMDSEGAAALEALEGNLNEPAMWKDFNFEPGQIQFLDNRRCGHKRTAFVDYPERKRRLVRLWLRNSGRPFYNG